jgi:hypothetical protein
MAKITNSLEFAGSFDNESIYNNAWAAVLCARIALRVLPYGIPHNGQGNWAKSLALFIIRSNGISWTVNGNTDWSIGREMGMSAANAVRNLTYDPNAVDEPAVVVSDISILSAEAASHAALTDVDVIGIAVDASRMASLAFEHVDSTANHAFWNSLEADCRWLFGNPEPEKAAYRLNMAELWPTGSPGGWELELQKAKSNLLSLDGHHSYRVWTDWYERRIRGEEAAFDIPGDKGRIEDKKILRRLAAATDEDFWGKGHEYVNATLKGWLDEARARHAVKSGWWQRTFGPSTPLDTINPDPQDGRSPQFGSDANGRIAIRPDAGADQLRSDIQSLSRHARALQMAQRLAEALRNHNNAGYMTEMASDYVSAMDSSDPSGIVFAGDQLREAIAKHRAAEADDDLQPLPPSADRDASAFLSAHNMYVGSDPFLDDLDRTTRGPDAPLPAANPDEIRRVATIARHDDILAEQTYDYIVAASEAAPANFDPADRHSRFVAGLAQNFARYGIEFLWSYPDEAAWAGLTAGAVVTVALGPLAAAGGTIAGIGIAYHMARNMIANEAIYEKLLATSPAGEDNFNRLMRFLKSLPIKSLKDD